MKKRNIKKKYNYKGLLLIIILIIVINIIFSFGKTYSKGEVQYKAEYISYGDTLWSIAERESKSNKYYQDKDVREIVYDLKQLNNMQSSDLSIGQEIKIPNI